MAQALKDPDAGTYGDADHVGDGFWRDQADCTAKKQDAHRPGQRSVQPAFGGAGQEEHPGTGRREDIQDAEQIALGQQQWADKEHERHDERGQPQLHGDHRGTPLVGLGDGSSGE